MKERPLTCGPNSPEDEAIKKPFNDPDSDAIMSPILVPSQQTHLKSLVAKENNVYVADEAETNSGYDTLSSSSPRYSTGDLDDNFDSDEIARLSSPTSSRSSISSFPASVIIHPMDDLKSSISPGIPQMEQTYNSTDGRDASKGGSARYARGIHAPFRHPSSVRAIQMDTEDEDEDFNTPSRCRRGVHGHRSPGISRSIESTPSKRPGCSSDGTPKKPTAKKEYPLVLLHCHLLPPTLSPATSLGIPNQHVLKEILPPKYWRRWKLLEEKIIGSGVLRERGILIPHPQEMYDILEERLLESLELEQPRLQNGHFISRDENDRIKEEDTDLATDDEKHGCPDCGSKVAIDGDINRKWEIKVYAANGLMKSGAWAAAWREMEKVDVEVSLWLPPNIRTALERRMADETTRSSETEVQTPNAVSHSGNSKDEPQLCQDQIDGLSDAIQTNNRSCATQNQDTIHQELDPAPRTACDNEIGNEVELQTLLINYLKVLARDKRNVAIAILSSLVLLFAVSGAQFRTPENRPVAQEIPEFVEPPIVTVTQFSRVSSISISTTTETLMLQAHPTRSVTTVNNKPKETTKQPSIPRLKTMEAMELSIPELESGGQKQVYAPYEQCPWQNGGGSGL